ncbi:MAG TPA: hypothetical protein VKB18_11450 [Gemmatimonadota bacterium]|nr:hypothetical protein [Gemmatimonadota bacterium]
MTPGRALRRCPANVPLVLGVLIMSSGLAACGSGAPNQVTVIGRDYAFEAPEVVPPGPTLLGFENRGEVDHEMVLVQLKESMTLEDVMAAVRSGQDRDDLMEGSPAVLIAAPHRSASSRLLVDLVAGRTYVLVCNLQDEPGAPPHMALGMRASFRVEPGAS